MEGPCVIVLRWLPEPLEVTKGKEADFCCKVLSPPCSSLVQQANPDVPRVVKAGPLSFSECGKVCFWFLEVNRVADGILCVVIL